MQNTVLIIGALVVIAGGAYLLLGSSGAPASESPTTEETPMNDTMTSQTATESAGEPSPSQPAEMPTMDIVETAVASDDFNTFVTAVTEAELVDTLKGDGPFTVFAPTDAAFAELPEGTVETLLQPENAADLTGVLTYHVVPSAVMSSDLSDGMTVATVNGETITIGVSDAGVTVNDATVVTADIETSNGVIHVIDSVLLP